MPAVTGGKGRGGTTSRAWREVGWQGAKAEEIRRGWLRAITKVLE
jgi:hypothetical protein